MLVIITLVVSLVIFCFILLFHRIFLSKSKRKWNLIYKNLNKVEYVKFDEIVCEYVFAMYVQDSSGERKKILTIKLHAVRETPFAVDEQTGEIISSLNGAYPVFENKLYRKLISLVPKEDFIGTRGFDTFL